MSIKDPAAPEPLVSATIQLKYAEPTNMVAAVMPILLDKRSRVVPDARTSQLVLLATEGEMDAVSKLMARLDTPTKQVLIEARLVETSKNPSSIKGIDWSGTLQNQHITFGNGITTGTIQQSSGNTTAYNAGTGSLPVGSQGVPYIAPNPVTLSTTFVGPPSTTIVTAAGTGATAGTTYGQLLNTVVGNGGLSLNTARGFNPATAFLNADGLSAVLSFLNSDLDASVVSVPRAVTLDNQTANLSVTRAFPIFKATAGTQGSPGGSEVTYTNLGTILRVTPHISAGNTISMKVIPEVSSLFGVATKTVAGVVNQADIFDVRRIETQVLIPSGNTLVMGGLMSDDKTKTSIKVPLFGDIPILGAAFRHQSKNQAKNNLIIFVTPTIVQNEDYQPTQTEFLKNKVPNDNSSDFGPWDSGKPQDWSKLFSKNGKASSTSDGSGSAYDSDPLSKK
jgi:type II secretory pathway component GspD/PulD (secretin)